MNFQETMITDLQDLYQAESEQAGRLTAFAQLAHSQELRIALEEHATETQQHVTRLAQILEMLGESPGGAGEVPPGVHGLINEAQKKAHRTEDHGIRDLAIIAGAQKMEHYEIACYGTMRAMARTAGMDDAARLLQETLDEEERADKRLTQIALPLLKQVAQPETVNT